MHLESYPFWCLTYGKAREIVVKVSDWGPHEAYPDTQSYQLNLVFDRFQLAAVQAYGKDCVYYLSLGLLFPAFVSLIVIWRTLSVNCQVCLCVCTHGMIFSYQN